MFPAQRVFVFPAVLGVAAIVPAAALLKQIAATGMRSLHGLEDASSVYANEDMQGDAGEAAASVPTVEKGTFGDSVRTVMGSSVLSLLFWGGVLAYAGYGAFDPLESLYYRDVLHVGIAWMGWLSSAAGVGSFAGAMLSLRVPNSVGERSHVALAHRLARCGVPALCGDSVPSSAPLRGRCFWVVRSA